MAPHQRDRSPANERDQQRRQVANSSTSLLSKLPAEIRNDIWRTALPSIVSLDATIRFERKQMFGLVNGYLTIDFIRNRKPSKGDLELATSLLGICHQIRTEATGIFYGETTFVLRTEMGSIRQWPESRFANDNDFELAVQWLKSLSTDAIKFFRHVVLVDLGTSLEDLRTFELDLKEHTTSHIFVLEESDDGSDAWSEGSGDESLEKCHCTYGQSGCEIKRVTQTNPYFAVGAAEDSRKSWALLASVFSDFSSWGKALGEKYYPEKDGASYAGRERKLKEVAGWIEELE